MADPFSNASNQWAKALESAQRNASTSGRQQGKSPMAAQAKGAPREAGAPNFRYQSPTPYGANYSTGATSSDREMAVATAARRQNQSELANRLGNQAAGYDPREDARFVDDRSNSNDNLLEARSNRVKDADWGRDSKASAQQHSQNMEAKERELQAQKEMQEKQINAQTSAQAMDWRSKQQREAEEYQQQLQQRHLRLDEDSQRDARVSRMRADDRTGELVRLDRQLQASQRPLARPNLDNEEDSAANLARIQADTARYHTYMQMSKGQDSRFWA